MIFTCSRQSLLDAISIVLPGCSSRPNAGVLRNIKAITAGSQLTLISTDTEITICTSIPVVIAPGGGGDAVTAASDRADGLGVGITAFPSLRRRDDDIDVEH